MFKFLENIFKPTLPSYLSKELLSADDCITDEELDITNDNSCVEPENVIDKPIGLTDASKQRLVNYIRSNLGIHDEHKINHHARLLERILIQNETYEPRVRIKK